MKDELIYIRHMLSSIEQIEKYLKKVPIGEFRKNRLLQDGVTRQIEIIGEASKQISDRLKLKYPSVPWKDIAGMRDKLIHGYLGVDIEIVWGVAEQHIPKLKAEMDRILKKECATE